MASAILDMWFHVLTRAAFGILAEKHLIQFADHVILIPFF